MEEKECFSCKNKFPVNELKLYRKKSYCPKCLEAKKEDLKKKKERNSLKNIDKDGIELSEEDVLKETDPKKALELKNAQNYKELMAYIFKKYNNDVPGIVFKQVAMFNKKMDYDYRAIRKTLEYCWELLEKEPSQEYGIELVRYYYKEARDFFQIEYEKKLKRKITPYTLEKQHQVFLVYGDAEVRDKYNKLMDEKTFQYNNDGIQMEDLIPEDWEDNAILEFGNQNTDEDEDDNSDYFYNEDKNNKGGII